MVLTDRQRAILQKVALQVANRAKRQKAARISARWRSRWASPKESFPCEICHQWQGMTHAHHLYPLAEQAFHGWREPDHTVIWLCPNHHALAHRIAAGLLTERPEWIGTREWTMASSLAEHMAKVSDPITELHALDMRRTRERWKRYQAAQAKEPS